MSTEQFYKYFKQQNATPLNNILDLETNMETLSNERVEGSIYSPITDEEFEVAGAPNENIVQNHLNIALLNVF